MRHTCAPPSAKDKEMLLPEEAKCKVLLSSPGKQQHLGAALHQLGALLMVCWGFARTPFVSIDLSSSYHKGN